MTTDNKVTEIYCLADDFCKYFSSLIKNRQIDSDSSVRRRNRKSTMSDAEVITILILFHMKGYWKIQRALTPCAKTKLTPEIILNHTGNGLLSGNHKKDNVKRLSLHIKKRK